MNKTVRTAVYAVIALALAAGSVRADPVEDGVVIETAVAASSAVFGYVTAPKKQANWARQQLASLRLGGRAKRFGVVPERAARRVSAVESMGRQGDPTSFSGATLDGEQDGTGAGGGGIGFGRGIGGGLMSGDGGSDSIVGVMDSAGVRAAIMERALADIPGAAFSVADAIKTFSDRTVELAMKLRSLFGETTRSNLWGALSRRKDLQSKTAPQAGAQGKSDEKGKKLNEAIARELRSKKIKRVVQSVFKVGLGVVLGAVLWIIVRRT